jgi:cytosine/adenosine deaminase-related metal-dependent hydrolase
MAGLAETRGPSDDSFWSWREVMYGFLDALTPDDVEAIAAYAAMDMLEAGTTAVAAFHYLHHDATESRSAIWPKCRRGSPLRRTRPACPP